MSRNTKTAIQVQEQDKKKQAPSIDDPLFRLGSIKSMVQRAAKASGMERDDMLRTIKTRKGENKTVGVRVSRKFLKKLDDLVKKETFAVLKITKSFSAQRKVKRIDRSAVEASFEVMDIVQNAPEIVDAPIVEKEDIDKVHQTIVDHRIANIAKKKEITFEQAKNEWEEKRKQLEESRRERIKKIKPASSSNNN